MKKKQLRSLTNKLTLLLKFLEKKIYSEEEIFDWISECVAFFTVIELNDILISKFIESFPIKNDRFFIDDINGGSELIGPFVKKTIVYTLEYSPGNFQYIDMAFNTANSILKNKETEYRLVPEPILESFKKGTLYRHIYSLLIDVENAVDNQDSSKLQSSSVSLLDEILSLNEILREKKNICYRLRALRTDKELAKIFGAARNELVSALDNGRIIRNVKVIHKNQPLEYNIPLQVAISYAYLVIYFIEILLSSGTLIKIEKDS